MIIVHHGISARPLPSPAAEPSGGTAGDLPGATIAWLFKSPRLGITLWDCAAGRRELSEERSQLWHVVSFVHSGAFVLHARGRSAVIDATSVLLHNPGEPFRSEHPFGCRDHGELHRHPAGAAARPAGTRTRLFPQPPRPRPLPGLTAPAAAGAPPAGRDAAGAHGDRGGRSQSAARGAQRGRSRPRALRRPPGARPAPAAATPRTPRRCCNSVSASGCNWTTSPGRSTSPPTTSAGCSGRRPACRSTAT